MSARQITPAEGYCEIGMWQDAWEELEPLEPKERAAPAVFRLRLRTLAILALDDEDLLPV